MRNFVVGAYWGGMLVAGFGFLPVLLFRPSIMPAGLIDQLHEITPALVFAWLGLLTSILSAGTMLVLREIGALRALIERAAALPARIPAKVSRWTGMADGGRNATISCHACGRTNWNDAHACVDCGAPLASGGHSAAH